MSLSRLVNWNDFNHCKNANRKHRFGFIHHHLRLSNTLFAKFEYKEYNVLYYNHLTINFAFEKRKFLVYYVLVFQFPRWRDSFVTIGIDLRCSTSGSIEISRESSPCCDRVVTCIVDRENYLRERSDSGNEVVT